MGFNPRPGLNPAATSGDDAKPLAVKFQSSAGPKPGRYDLAGDERDFVDGFNPRPGLNPAATDLDLAAVPVVAVSILGRA